MTHGSLFTGIGGFDLAAQWMGWENVFQVEINPDCQKILKQKFPEAKKHGDIRTTDFTIYRRLVDVLSGGFPCQPFSISGERRGINDDRALWPEMLRAIQEVWPYWVVGENVTGIKSMALEHYCSDLENIGFEVQPIDISACCVGINQDRERTWIVAHNNRRQREEPYQRSLLHSKISPVDVARPEPVALRGRKNNGLPKELDTCKRIGLAANAIVPQVAYEIFKAIEQIT